MGCSCSAHVFTAHNLGARTVLLPNTTPHVILIALLGGMVFPTLWTGQLRLREGSAQGQQYEADLELEPRSDQKDLQEHVQCSRGIVHRLTIALQLKCCSPHSVDKRAKAQTGGGWPQATQQI